jgi:translation initiation factor IF-3
MARAARLPNRRFRQVQVPGTEAPARAAKLKQKQVQVKEVKFRPGTDENDYQIKLRNMTRFLEEEDKVKVTLRFRGREMAHQDIGMRQIERIKAICRKWRWSSRCRRWKGARWSWC